MGSLTFLACDLVSHAGFVVVKITAQHMPCGSWNSRLCFITTFLTTCLDWETLNIYQACSVEVLLEFIIVATLTDIRFLYNMIIFCIIVESVYSPPRPFFLTVIDNKQDNLSKMCIRTQKITALMRSPDYEICKPNSVTTVLLLKTNPNFCVKF